jgi:prepilin-type N-terminal cleavage/methylation domain-containing protein
MHILRYNGFTLAEVLITLLIVGVISSLVIPGIIQDSQDAELKTAWKKSYSGLDQATRLILADNAGSLRSYIDHYGGSILPLIKGKLHYSKYGLSFTKTTTPAFNYKNLNGTNTDFGHFDDEQMILSSGIFIIANCAYCNGIIGHIIWVDVNGYIKGPNVVGKDIFGVKVYDNGIKPMGSQGDEYENTCNTTSGARSGWGCGAVYLYQ